MGFPYYSPPRPRKTPHEQSNPTNKTDDKSENDSEAINEGAATDGEQMEHETSKDAVTVVEKDSQSQRRTSGRKGRGRGSNASESSESKKDDSPNQQQDSSKKPDLTASSSSSNTHSKVNESAGDTPKEVRMLNNSHTRRQIIRPWEDNITSSKQILSIDNLHTNSQKKLLQNGSMSTPPALTSFSTFTSPKMQHEQQDSHDGSSNGAASNSVQTAAEALVEIGQLPPSTSSQDATVESMEVETKKSTSPSVSSTLNASSSSASLALGNVSASLDMPNVPKEVVIDRKRQLNLFHHVTRATESCSVEQMDRLHSTFEHIVFLHRMTLHKQRLIEVNCHELDAIII